MSFAIYPSLRDRRVIVTGGASGIGAEIVRAFATQGAQVGFLDRDVAASNTLVGELDGAWHTPTSIDPLVGTAACCASAVSAPPR